MKILLAEDDIEMAEFVARGLDELGHNVVRATSGVDALHLATTEPFDLALLDRMLPEMDGVAVLRRLRAAQDRDAGPAADRARPDRGPGRRPRRRRRRLSGQAVRVLRARRADQRARPPRTDQLAGDPVRVRATVDGPAAREVRRDGEAITLQPREFRLLEELLRNSERAVTRTMLLERVWGFHFDPQTNIVETHISRMRAKLNEGGKPDLIETIRGVGYRMRPGDEAKDI